ncbi:hypothetical protein DOZ80_01715 [Pseudomonas fluorescens]|uniref:Uncharacterized protein n=1 Tax=Pseudomonas fluorescens TaxID=294 RepID=A0A327NAT1_PSEFL|nr:hypothetical protein DOZ80_01715 [Pseudomonas fluorescens]
MARFFGWMESPVGASLLAIAVVQPPSMLHVPTPSRASPLPQGSAVGAQALPGIPYLRNRWAIAVWEVCRRVASCRVEG